MQILLRNNEFTSGNYSYLPIERVYFGPREIKQISTELDRKGSKRPFVITGQTIATKTRLLDRIESAAGRKFAGIYPYIKQHAPWSGIEEAVSEVKKTGADSLLSIGGGSPIDSTKIIVRELSENFKKNPIPHFAIPTTLSAAEFSHVAGYTDEASNRKSGLRDERMVPQVVFLDPELTIDTPRWLWASTGIRALDHAVESVYSPKHQLYVDTLSLQAIRLIFSFLKKSSETPSDYPARLACQIAAWMSFSGVLSVGTGLSHAIGRVVGATWKIPHGITSCITLSEVMRHEAIRQPERLSLIAEAEGQNVTSISHEQAVLAAKGVQDLIDDLGLSKKLHDYGITSGDLPKIAREAAPPERYDETLKVLERIL